MTTIDTQGIAQLLGCSRRHVTDRLIKRPDFPAPKVDVSRKMRRWDPEDVTRWASPSARQSPQA